MTPKQLKALDYIAGYIREHRLAPSFDEIADAMGLRSRSGAHRFVTLLEDRGCIKRTPARYRSIELTEKGRRLCGFAAKS